MRTSFYHLTGHTAVELRQEPYAEEVILQDLVIANPNLVARKSQDGSDHLIYICRECEVSDLCGNAYSLDILLADSTGVPVLVEVKRSSDTRIRREVMAQMIDYAAGARRWDMSKLRSHFKKNNSSDTCAMYDNDDFWGSFSSYLEQEKFRLAFVADEIPESLASMIDFMDRNMADIDVYGVEIKQYISDGATLLSASSIGEKTFTQQSATAWTADLFTSFLSTHSLGAEIPLVNKLLDFASKSELSVAFGKGAKFPSFKLTFRGIKIFNVTAWSNKTKGDICALEFSIADLVPYLPESWAEDGLQKKLLASQSSSSLNQQSLFWASNHYVYITLKSLHSDDNFEQLTALILEIRDQIAKTVGE